MESEKLLNDRALRDQCVGRYEILGKVKELLLIPGTELASTQQVASYYNVKIDAIRQLSVRNHDELNLDGIQVLNGKEIIDMLDRDNKSLTKHRGYLMVGDIRIAHAKNMLFPRRAILRVGMLLRDSEVAKEVRTQLLNIEDNSSEEIKVKDIDEERKLAITLGMAVASGDATAVAIASAKMMDFKNRHIDKLKQDNKGLAGEILEWRDRSKLNAGVRMLAVVTHKPFYEIWNELYKNLQYRYSINLRGRGNGKKPYIDNVKQTEWDFVVKTFCALCEAYNQSPSDMFQQRTIVGK